jgi:hypothetical protein
MRIEMVTSQIQYTSETVETFLLGIEYSKTPRFRIANCPDRLDPSENFLKSYKTNLP